LGAEIDDKDWTLGHVLSSGTMLIRHHVAVPVNDIVSGQDDKRAATGLIVDAEGPTTRRKEAAAFTREE
jgi:hypothetical protein